MTPLSIFPEPRIEYPESDGKPMADNTIQFRWITTIQGNPDLLFHDRPDVFVAGDNFWYPVKGEPETKLAPDVYVVFGRPKGDRGNYKQWEEGGIPPSVVVEVLSPSNTVAEMHGKFDFYERHGAKEYYIIDPVGAATTLEIFEREGTKLKSRHSPAPTEWVSPLLGVRFVATPSDVELYYPDGKPFLTFVQLGELQKQTEQALEIERRRAEAVRVRAESESQRADAKRERADAERERADRLAARLRALDVNPDAL